MSDIFVEYRLGAARILVQRKGAIIDMNENEQAAHVAEAASDKRKSLWRKGCLIVGIVWGGSLLFSLLLLGIAGPKGAPDPQSPAPPPKASPLPAPTPSATLTAQSEAPPVVAQVEPIAKLDAIDVCQKAILARASHPSTVEFPTFDYDFRDAGDGSSKLLMSFKAKNGFGLELKYDAECDFFGHAVKAVLMSEATGG